MATRRLTVSKVDRMSEPGRYADGGCLFLVVTPGGAKQWVARLTIKGKQTDLGLGGVSYTTLAEARDEAARLRKIARQGADPREERRRGSLTFAEAAKRVHANLVPTWRNAKHAETWLATVENYANPHFGDRPIETIGKADILKALTPIWTEKHETAKRLKQRLSTIFDWANGAGHYPPENPVNGLNRALPRVKRRPTHMAAMRWRDLPAFIVDLTQREGLSARTLEFLVLTGTRSGEARGARWSEIEDGIWTIPPERMKRGVPHRVPLSREALAVLERVRGLDPDLIFPSQKRGPRGEARPQSVMVFKALLARMDRSGFTVHGMRSTFRDWCSESAHADREVAEAALSHTTGNEVERAYARSDLFERRRALMDAWGRYATGKAGDVVQMVRA
jgi:integrase